MGECDEFGCVVVLVGLITLAGMFECVDLSGYLVLVGFIALVGTCGCVDFESVVRVVSLGWYHRVVSCVVHDRWKSRLRVRRRLEGQFADGGVASRATVPRLVSHYGQWLRGVLGEVYSFTPVIQIACSCNVPVFDPSHSFIHCVLVSRSLSQSLSVSSCVCLCVSPLFSPSPSHFLLFFLTYSFLLFLHLSPSHFVCLSLSLSLFCVFSWVLLVFMFSSIACHLWFLLIHRAPLSNSLLALLLCCVISSSYFLRKSFSMKKLSHYHTYRGGSCSQFKLSPFSRCFAHKITQCR